MKLLFDLLPIILFFAAFKFGESDPEAVAAALSVITGGTDATHAPVLGATVVAIAATLIQVALVFARGKKPEPMLWISLAVILVFGSLTVWLQNEMFIKWKPTILYWIFGTILLYGECTGKNFLSKLLSSAELNLNHKDWSELQRMWIGFFTIVGFINLAVAYTMSTEAWVNFKLFGLLALTLIFTIGIGFRIAKKASGLQQ